MQKAGKEPRGANPGGRKTRIPLARSAIESKGKKPSHTSTADPLASREKIMNIEFSTIDPRGHVRIRVRIWNLTSSGSSNRSRHGNEWLHDLREHVLHLQQLTLGALESSLKSGIMPRRRDNRRLKAPRRRSEDRSERPSRRASGPSMSRRALANRHRIRLQSLSRRLRR